MKTFHKVAKLREELSASRRAGQRIVFVPTMGALHSGHCRLVEIARSHGDLVVMSIFVNAKQFNSAEDLNSYPRDAARDSEIARNAQVDVLFLPSEEEVYPNDSATGRTMVRPGERAQGLCGASRPGHFEGVVTVVSILFHMLEPDAAVFGEKDYQQLAVIEQMVEELHFPVEIIRAPLVRDDDGLATSSRNLKLNSEQRGEALKLSQALFQAQKQVAAGEQLAEKILSSAREVLLSSSLIRLDYLEIVDVKTLAPLPRIESEAQLMLAAYVGDVRLIDNIRLSL